MKIKVLWSTCLLLSKVMFVVLCCTHSAFGQKVEEHLIVSGEKDPLVVQSQELSFDKEGNYCAVVTKDGKQYFQTKTGLSAAFDFIGSTYGKHGEINYTSRSTTDHPWYYKNANGTRLYGPVKGKLESYETSETRENIALTVTYNDSVYHYLNGKQMSKLGMANADKFYLTLEDWCAFSENGNAIYFIKKDSIYYLYANNKLIDNSRFRYTQLAINDRGEYVFAKGEKPRTKIGKYDYMFFTHSPKAVNGPIRTVWDYKLKADGSYFYSGDDNGPYYIVINDQLHKNIKRIANITLEGKNNFLYTYQEDGVNKIKVNDKVFEHSFEKVLLPALSISGSFACYGLKNYYLYKYINGKQEKDPISNYDVRPEPLYISPTGKSLHYFKTSDSVYLYSDSELVLDPISTQTDFIVKSYRDVIPNSFPNKKGSNSNSLLYLQYGVKAYWVFNGIFSAPMLPVGDNQGTNGLPQFVAGQLNDTGFYSIQKTGRSNYLVNLNNQVYQELTNLDSILVQNCFFDSSTLVFYGIKNQSVYRISVSQ